VRATIAIVSYNPGAFLQTCVDALAEQTFRDFEAVIYDNASTDDAISTLRLPDERFRVVAATENSGFAAGSNRVAEMSSAEFFVTLNPDAIPEPGWLRGLIDSVEAWPNTVSVGSTQLTLSDLGLIDGAGDVWHVAGTGWRALHGQSAKTLPPEGETFSACGAAALYRREAFAEVGGFDERFFCYCEDLDLGFRLRLRGARIVQSRRAVVRHAGSASTGEQSDFTLYHGHRNRIWVFVKNTPTLLLVVAAPYHLVLNAYLLVVAARMGTFGTFVRAYRDAISGLPAMWRTRKKIQATRTISALEAARQLAWSPRSLRWRPTYRQHSDRIIANEGRGGITARSDS
jgi:N-acetylglucosaminyl-diphospho-decaprenol L-rhamnosyltransferase